MTLSDTTALPARVDIERWRRRSRVVRAMRIVLPGSIVVILAALAGLMALSALGPGPEPLQENNQPIRLVNPRFVGRDDRGRPFTITALTATRDPREYQKVYLDHPNLVIDEQGSDPTRIGSAKGIYYETTGKLDVSGGVRMASKQASFETAASQFDVKTGELVGSGPVHGIGALGEIQAKSYGVYDKGDRMVFQGGVHTRLNPK